MSRLLIIGSPGAGKSTFANRLAARTGLPLTHLDDLYWSRGWRQVEREVWLARLHAALAGEQWIIDGNFSSTLLQRAYRADEVIFIRPPRWRCLWRAFWREALGRSPHGGHTPKWPSKALLQDIWTFGPQGDWQLALLQTVPGLKITQVRTDAELERVLAQH